MEAIHRRVLGKPKFLHWCERQAQAFVLYGRKTAYMAPGCQLEFDSKAYKAPKPCM